MNKGSIKKYVPYRGIEGFKRTWPDKTITKAPRWCSVDLRDGNQALPTPLSPEEKMEFFKLLVKIGFKEIEIGFPSASQMEFDFTRRLIDEKIVPSDVTIQVLVQAREELIARTYESLKGCGKAIIHVYNSTSENQRRIVFAKGKDEIKGLALEGVRLVKKYAAIADFTTILQYSPESFTGTELDYALEVSNEVIAAWAPAQDNKMILNLPSTMEMSTPNMFADRIEFMSKNIRDRANVIVSVHAHNDRGEGVAAAELAILAGAERVEGALFGNGERTGNCDLVTVALNMFSQGVDPELDFHDLPAIVKEVEKLNKLSVPERSPYAGELVFTAFSGSHQDAIRKGIEYRKKNNSEIWDVPYLPIDPSDLGRSYEGIIRIHSQSGKGGIAYIMENEFGFIMPKAMHPEFSRVIQKMADVTGKEIMPAEIYEVFRKEFIDKKGSFEYVDLMINSEKPGAVNVSVTLKHNGQLKTIGGQGNGPLDAVRNALVTEAGVDAFNITDYQEHSLTEGSAAKAAAYVRIEKVDNSGKVFGVGLDTDITIAAVRALFNGLNRLS